MMPVVSTPAARRPWQMIVPVRGGAVGKSRLVSIEGRTLTDGDRNDLALAMARDTVSAAVASDRGRVVVLTADEVVASMARQCGAAVAVDSGRGLNTELARAAVSLASTVGVCVLLGDLPALRPEDLGAGLDLADSERGAGVVVPDWEGTGTTLVARAPCEGSAVTFGFGPGSAERHQRAGLHVAGLHLARLRADVDIPEGWGRAVRLGLGPATAALRAHLLAHPR